MNITIIPSIRTYKRQFNALPTYHLTSIQVTEKTPNVKYNRGVEVHTETVSVPDEKTKKESSDIDVKYGGSFTKYDQYGRDYVYQRFAFSAIYASVEYATFQIEVPKKQDNLYVEKIPFVDAKTGDRQDISLSFSGESSYGGTWYIVNGKIPSGTEDVNIINVTITEPEVRETAEDVSFVSSKEDFFVKTQVPAMEDETLYATVSAEDIYDGDYGYTVRSIKEEDDKYLLTIEAMVEVALIKSSVNSPIKSSTPTGWMELGHFTLSGEDLVISAPGTYEKYTAKKINVSVFGSSYSIYTEDAIKTYTVQSDLSPSAYTVESNELIQDGVSERYEVTLTNYQTPKETATILCDIGEYKTTSGELAISTKDSSLPMLFQKYDIVRPMVRNADGTDRPLSSYKDGTPKDFMVLSSRLIYDGEIMQEIICQEY